MESMGTILHSVLQSSCIKYPEQKELGFICMSCDISHEVLENFSFCGIMPLDVMPFY